MVQTKSQNLHLIRLFHMSRKEGRERREVRKDGKKERRKEGKKERG